MTDATPSRIGQADLTGDAKALFEKVFTGEVLTAFEASVLLKERTRTKTITHGKSASFGATFEASGGYHTPGAELLGQTVAHNEVVIAIDDLLVSDIFVASIDEAMASYEVRGEYSQKMGYFLAQQYDKNIARNIIRAARGGALFTGDTGGAELIDADSDTSALSLAASIWEAKQTMEEKNVPVDMLPVTASVLPAQWYLLAQEPTLILNRDVDGDGSYSQGAFSLIGGVEVIKSNSFPWGTDDSANGDIPADYRVDMSNTTAAVFVPDAAATVQLMGLNFEVVPQGAKRGDLLVAEYAVGHGPLRTKAAVEIKTA